MKQLSPQSVLPCLFALVAMILLAPALAADQSPVTTDAVTGLEAELEPMGLTIGQQCGGAVCGKGTYCCNPTCSLCLPFGMSCTQEVCNSDVNAEPDFPEFEVQPVPQPEPAPRPETDAELIEAGFSLYPIPCGSNLCQKGTFCCNASCGVCAPLGGACLDIFCPPVE